MKIKTKITLLFFAISTAGLVLLNAAIFYFVSEFSFEDFFKRLEARVKLAAEINIHPDEKSVAYKEVRSRYLEKLAEERDFVIPVSNTDSSKFNRPIKLPESFYGKILQNGRARFTDDNRFYAGSYFKTEYGKYIIIVAAADPYGFQELQALRRVLILIFIVSIILTYVAGHFFSAYIIGPIRTVIGRVNNITANNLHLRLTEVKSKDEIAEMVLTFNNMLNRLETAFETQNNFVSNASHELRTPLTIITSEAELLLAKQRSQQEVTSSVNRIFKEAEKLGHILASLLGLAQSGFDGKKQNWQRIRVDELVFDVVDSVKKIEPDATINIDMAALPEDENLLFTEGNLNLLQLAVSNIILNACKYSNNQPVDVKITAKNTTIALIVTDRGIGIPLQEQQHIFEPFFRASNTSSFEGHGIGLPLTLNIIRLHKGSIGIRSEEMTGTEIQVLLPVGPLAPCP